MNGGDGPAVQLCNVAQVFHIREVPPGDGDGRFLYFTGPKRRYTVPDSGQRKYTDAIK